jgi:hypothetical protein
MSTNPNPASTGTLRPVLYNPTGLRRWRAALALADQQVVPIVSVGDSIVWGQGSDNTLTTTNVVAAVKSWPARLRARFGLDPATAGGAVGEGYIFANDSRITTGGSPVANAWSCTALNQGYRLVGATQTLTLTIPTGVTSIGVIQANQTQAFNSAGSNLADQAGQYNINAGGNTPLTTLTNTGLPIVTNVAVTAGQSFQVIGPATAQTYINGFLLNNAATTGVQVHRVGLNGAVSGRLLGGQVNGVLQQAASPQNQIYAAQACYNWAANGPGLVICSFSVNDQAFSLGGGTASQNFVTLPLYQAWNLQFAQQAVTDGWSVLFVGNYRDQGFTGYATLDAYMAAMKAIAVSSPNMAYMDFGEVWGGFTQSQADGIQVSGSVHPNTAGCGDMANTLYAMLQGQAWNGITEAIVG